MRHGQVTASLMHAAGWARSRYALLLVLLALGAMVGCDPIGTGEDTEPAKAAQAEAEQIPREEAPAEAEQPPQEVSEAEGEQLAEEEGEDAAQKAEEEPPIWDKPRFTERKEERERMVEQQIAGRRYGGVKNEHVLEAMQQVPRHLFVRPGEQRAAYADRPLPIGYGQTISQPYIVGLMTELLEVEPGDRLLEIGTGSGYQAAVLTELTPHVYTMEIIKKLGLSAQERLEKLGYKTAEVKVEDGYFGWEEHAPFDGIIVTCAAGHIPPPLLKQLKPGGRMVIPVGAAFETQFLVVVSKDEGGNIRSRQVLPVRFVPMTGRAQEDP